MPDDQEGFETGDDPRDFGTTGDPAPDNTFAPGTAVPPVDYEPDFTIQTGPPTEEVELTPSELVTQVMADVESIKSLRAELALKIDRVRDVQRRLIDHGMVMDFPVLNEVTLGAPAKVPHNEGSSLVIGEAVVPARSDEEVRNAPMELESDGRDVNEGAPARPAVPDRRDEKQVAADSFINPSQGQVDQFQQAVEKGYENAVENAFTDAGKKVDAANKKVTGGVGGGMGWMNPFNNV